MRVNDWYNQRADIYRGANAHTGARRSADYNPILLSFNDPERDSRARPIEKPPLGRRHVRKRARYRSSRSSLPAPGKREGECSREAAAMEIAPRRSRRGNGRSKSRGLTSVDFIIDVARGYARDRLDPPKVHD